MIKIESTKEGGQPCKPLKYTSERKSRAIAARACIKVKTAGGARMRTGRTTR